MSRYCLRSSNDALDRVAGNLIVTRPSSNVKTSSPVPPFGFTMPIIDICYSLVEVCIRSRQSNSHAVRFRSDVSKSIVIVLTRFDDLLIFILFLCRLLRWELGLSLANAQDSGRGVLKFLRAGNHDCGRDTDRHAQGARAFLKCPCKVFG